MAGNWQGPASFESVLAEAAKLAEAQNNRAETVRQMRSAELQRIAAQIDNGLDNRRNRAAHASLWVQHSELIMSRYRDGVIYSEIVQELEDLGLRVDERAVKRFVRRNEMQAGAGSQIGRDE